MTPIQESLVNELLTTLKLNKRDEKEIDEVLGTTKELKCLELLHLGEPKAQTRPRAVRMGAGIRMYDQSAPIKESLANSIILQLGTDFRPLKSELFFELKFFKSYPKSFSKKKQLLAETGHLRPTNKPDIDNYEKLVFDALKGVLYVDDGLVVSCKSEKYYSIKPRVEIKVWYYEE